MKPSSTFACAAALLAAAALRAPGATYLKAGAAGTGDGTSWANACTNFAAAFAAAQAGDNVLYAAKGVYTIAATPVPTDGFRLYGGFRGDETGSPEEMLAARDADLNQTIFTSDKGGRHFQWVHVGPGEPGAFSWQELERLDPAAYPVLGGDTFVPPPPTTGDFDGYYLSSSDRYGSFALDVHKNVDFTVDGVWYLAMSGGINIRAAHTNETVTRHVTNCRFIGSPGIIMVNGDFSGSLATPAVLIGQCRFSHFLGDCVVRGYGRRLRIEDCDFSHIVRPAAGANRGSATIYCWGYGYVEVSGCTFSRNLFVTSAAGETPDYPCANCVSWEAVTAINVSGCVFTNNLSYSKHGLGCTLVGAKNGRIDGCYFARNRLEVKPAALSPYSLVVVTPGYGEPFSCVAGCTFESNTVAATALNLSGGSYALGIVGTGTGKTRQSVEGCTFADNAVEAVEAAGVTPVLSQGVLFAENVSATAGARCGVADCTFVRTGNDAGVCDIAQYSPLHNSAFPVVNCIFSRGWRSDFNPFYADVPSLLVVRQCSAAGLDAPPAGIGFAGLETDPVPLAREVSPDGRNVFYRPAARTPGLRASADVAPNDDGEFKRTYRYRLPGETVWTPLLAGEALAAATPAPVADACGAPRAFGLYTRGAVQALADAAESGRTLLLRCDPAKLADFTGAPWWQVVPPGGTATPVTAVGRSGATFLRWTDEGGATISTQPTLSGFSPTGDLAIVTAVLDPAMVTLTFDLRHYGVFADNGTTTRSVLCAVGTPMPQFAVADAPGWHFEGWEDGLPGKVPETSRTFYATGVTKDLRIVHLVPADDPALATGRQDGSSWADAFGNLPDAIGDAMRWRGEVRIKRGVYDIPAAIPSFSNVRLRGGWAGDEGPEDSPDPDANPTVMTGDVNHDDYWRPGNQDPGAAFRTNVWDYASLSFRMPAPGFESYWAATGNAADDTPSFITDNGAVTNCQIEGLAITGFRNAAVTIVVSSSMDFSRCRFLANNTALRTGMEGAALFVSGNAAFDGCDFIGSHTPLAFVNAAAIYKGTNRVENCRFLYNHGTGTGTGGGLIVSTPFKDFVLSGCRIANNFIWEYQGYQHCPVQFDLVRDLTVSDTLVEDNVAKNRCVSVFYVGQVKGRLRISRCLFRRNVKIGHGTDSGGTAGTLRIGNADPSRQAVVEDCVFEDNAVLRQGESNSSSSTRVCEQASCVNVRRGRVALVNCTFRDNVADTTGAPNLGTGAAANPLAGTILAGGEEAHLALVNCALDGNEVEGPVAAEICTRGTASSTAFALRNTALWGQAADYVPFVLDSASQPVGVAQSVVRNAGAGLCCATSCWDSVWGEDPQFWLKPSATGDERAMLKVRAPRYARAARPVWEAEDGFLYYLDATTDPGKPWRRVTDATFFRAEAPAGVTPSSAPLPDAYGARRSPRGYTLGPLGSGPDAMMLWLR